ncbi:MAG: hypothetical protein KDB61_04740, partial [Planctomycetes bacterium]|nr:hypothetical protein [Planctomycetota bacterium]
MAESEPQPRPRRIRRYLKRFLLLGVAGIVIVALLPNHTLNPLIGWVAPKVAKSAGYDLKLQGVSGAPWQEWRIQGLSLTPENGGTALRSMEFEDLRLRLGSGFWLSPGPEGVEEIWVRGLTVDVAAVESQGSTGTSGGDSEFAWDLSQWPRMDLDDCNVTFTGAGV